jgi:hypothetical protein
MGHWVNTHEYPYHTYPISSIITMITNFSWQKNHRPSQQNSNHGKVEAHFIVGKELSATHHDFKPEKSGSHCRMLPWGGNGRGGDEF